MRIDSLEALATTDQVQRAKGPVAAIIAEDAVEVEATIRHHLGLGFQPVLFDGFSGRNDDGCCAIIHTRCVAWCYRSTILAERCW